MSWDVILFNSKQKINSVQELDESQLEPTDFCSVLEKHFHQMEKDGNHRGIREKNFVINYFIDDELVSVKVLSVYGEEGVFELIVLARKNNWQLFDTGLDQMLDLENPAKNGYESFQNYLNHILNDKK